jgi:anti-anti-sigma factor
MMFSIRVDEQADGHVICRPMGELDIYAVYQFRQALADLPLGSRVLIDMSDVSFVDASGLGALVGGVRRARGRGGDASLTYAKPVLMRLLQTIGLDRTVMIADDLDPATAAV